MKKINVKGFTLLELIVVMVIFSIVMFGAMQLMIPSRALFDRSYQSEELSAGEKNIKMYLEDSLRYAEFVQIDEIDPANGSEISYALPKAQTISTVWNTAAKPFVQSRYNGWVQKDGVTPGEGTVHVMYIDNNRGGQIMHYEYGFKAPNVDPAGTHHEPAGTDADNYTSHHATEWAVNKAFYDRYHYLISLGVTVPQATPQSVDGKTVQLVHPVKDNDYYSRFNQVDYQQLSRQNFSLTINGYDTAPNHSTIVTDAHGVKHYSQLTTMTANMSFPNMQYGRNIFIHSNWVEDSANPGTYIHPETAPGSGTVKFCNEIQSGCHLVDPADLAKQVSSYNQYINNVTDEAHRAEPKCIRIIYTYPQV